MSFKGNTFGSPSWKDTFANFTVGADHWIVEHNSLFDVEATRCVYPLSPQYQLFPRYLYYALTVVSILSRKSTWIATATIGAVMTYSGVAAVHAFAIASGRQKHVPEWTHEKALLAVNAWDWVTVDSRVSIPVLPQAWDDDGDAVLAVVGVAYLVLAGMQTYSDTFRQSQAKPILFLWSLLLLVGMISALVNWQYVDSWAFPQFRFCPSSWNESLPIVKSRFDDSSSPWNDTIWSAFSNLTSRKVPNSCIYPCLSTSWALRADSEINVRPISTIGHVGYSNFSVLTNFIYALVASSGVCSLTVFLIKTAGWNGDHKVCSTVRDFLRSRSFFKLSTSVKFAQIFWDLYILIIDVYARFGSIVVLLGFAVWVEWIMWYDPVAEHFRDVGQWGQLVGAGLLLIGALVAQYGDMVSGFIAPAVAEYGRRFSGFICHVVKYSANRIFALLGRQRVKAGQHSLSDISKGAPREGEVKVVICYEDAEERCRE